MPAYAQAMPGDAIERWKESTAPVASFVRDLVTLPTSSLSFWMLGAALLTSLLWYRYSGRKVRSWRVLWRAMLPRHYLTSRSARGDYLTSLFGYAILGTSLVVTLFGLATMPMTLRNALAALTGIEQALAVSPLTAQIGTTLLAFVGYEAAYWTDHWLKHEIPFLWHYHKVHHSAETLSPLTNLRMHPFDVFLFFASNGTGLAAGIGLSFWLFGPAAHQIEVMGANALLMIAAYTVITLQHSQVWIPLRGWAGKLILSPAHHQLHHSVDPAHHNSNYGSVLAVFDWMAGTLNIPPRKSPRLKFGVDGLGYDPHSLKGLFLMPIRDALASLLPASRASQAPYPRAEA